MKNILVSSVLQRPQLVTLSIPHRNKREKYSVLSLNKIDVS